jgi:hypothetical protein
MEYTRGALPPSIDEYNLQDTLEKAQDELVDLIRKRKQIDWRIEKLQSDIVHLAALCGVEIEDPMSQLGLTDAVRWIVAKGTQKGGVNSLADKLKGPMTSAEITEALEKEYPSASKYKNLTANVQTILKRLVKSKAVKVEEYGVEGTVRYTWIGGLLPMPPPPGWLEERMKE